MRKKPGSNIYAKIWYMLVDRRLRRKKWLHKHTNESHFVYFFIYIYYYFSVDCCCCTISHTSFHIRFLFRWLHLHWHLFGFDKRVCVINIGFSIAIAYCFFACRIFVRQSTINGRDVSWRIQVNKIISKFLKRISRMLGIDFLWLFCICIQRKNQDLLISAGGCNNQIEMLNYTSNPKFCGFKLNFFQIIFH